MTVSNMAILSALLVGMLNRYKSVSDQVVSEILTPKNPAGAIGASNWSPRSQEWSFRIELSSALATKAADREN